MPTRTPTGIYPETPHAAKAKTQNPFRAVFLFRYHFLDTCWTIFGRFLGVWRALGATDGLVYRFSTYPVPKISPQTFENPVFCDLKFCKNRRAEIDGF